MTDPAHLDACFTDYALQEYVAGRLDPDVRAQLETHVVHCDTCRSAVGLLREEADFLRVALRPADTTTPTEPVDSAFLGVYLSGALSVDETTAMEARLAGDASVLLELLRLRAETLATLGEWGGGIREGTTAVPAGVVLRMPTRRVHPPDVIQVKERRYGGRHGG